MTTNQLFGALFIKEKRFKDRLLANFETWKAEKQFYQTKRRNDRKVFERIVEKHKKDRPKDYRAPEDIAEELWEKLNADITLLNWEIIYERILGKDQKSPSYKGPPFIDKHDVNRLFSDKDYEHFCFTESAVKECEEIYTPEILDLTWLQESKDGKRQIDYGDSFFRYEKTGNTIIALSASLTRRQDEKKYIRHTFFRLDLTTQKVLFKEHNDPLVALIEAEYLREFDEYSHSEDFEKKSIELLFKMITFLDLIPLRRIMLAPGEKVDKDSSPDEADHAINEEKYSITFISVKANWNYTVCIEPTEVRGYWKDMMCGRGRKIKDSRWVRKHRRSGYERQAGKIKASEAPA